MKPTKRKAFSFLRSYFDVLNKIKDREDKLDFLLAIIDKQFLNEEPKEMEFIVDLCYESQRHSIEKSVNGWLRVNKGGIMGEVISNPTSNPPLHVGSNPKEEEEKEEEKEEVEVEEENVLFDINKLSLKYLKDDKLSNAVISNKANKLKDKDHLTKRISEYNEMLTEKGRHCETWKEYCSYFRNWNKLTMYIDSKDKEFLNPNNEEIITFNSNVNPTVFKLVKSKFLELQSKNKSGGYIYKIIS